MILDTNALSALAGKDPLLVKKIETASRLHTTLISLGEFSYGIALSKNRAELKRWLEAFLKKAEVISPNMATLSHYTEVRKGLRSGGTPIPANDCWIAALAKQHKMPVVSRDRHFDKVEGIRRIEW